MVTLVDGDTFRYIMVCVVLFGSLHLALRVPLRMAGIVFKLIKYGIILNFLMLVLAFHSLSGDTRFGMLLGVAIWAPMALCLVGGRADDYERSMGRGKPAIPVVPVVPASTSTAPLPPHEKKADKSGTVVMILTLVVIGLFLRWVESFVHFTLEGVVGATIIVTVWCSIISGRL
jgi:hypothetical protein